MHSRTLQTEPLTFVLQDQFLLVVLSDSYPLFLLDLSPDISSPPGIQCSISSVCDCITIAMCTESSGLWLESLHSSPHFIMTGILNQMKDLGDLDTIRGNGLYFRKQYSNRGCPRLHLSSGLEDTLPSVL